MTTNEVVEKTVETMQEVVETGTNWKSIAFRGLAVIGGGTLLWNSAKWIKSKFSKPAETTEAKADA